MPPGLPSPPFGPARGAPRFPCLDATLEGPQLTVRIPARIPPLQHPEENRRLEGAVPLEKGLYLTGPDIGKGIGMGPPVPAGPGELAPFYAATGPLGNAGHGRGCLLGPACLSCFLVHLDLHLVDRPARHGKPPWVNSDPDANPVQRPGQLSATGPRN